MYIYTHTYIHTHTHTHIYLYKQIFNFIKQWKQIISKIRLNLRFSKCAHDRMNVYVDFMVLWTIFHSQEISAINKPIVCHQGFYSKV